MSDIWSNCFSFVLVTFKQPVFQNCKEILCVPCCSLAGGYVETNLKTVCCLTSGSFFFPIMIVEQNVSFHGQVGRVIGQTYI